MALVLSYSEYLLIVDEESTDLYKLIELISKKLFDMGLYREIYELYKRNREYVEEEEYMVYEIYFREVEGQVIFINEAERVLDKEYIIGVEEEEIGSLLEKLNGNCTLSSKYNTHPSKYNTLTNRYKIYQSLVNIEKTKDDTLRDIYEMLFMDKEYSYERLIRNIKEYERYDILEIFLNKYYIDELEEIRKEILEDIKRDEISFIRMCIKEGKYI